ncbi:hypothetical protein LTR78_003363 [Recurvomyces mirabilis]|uniref:Xylanolytic transcriptional activator regulatory domain-containing protein n=1 Tax=Recurvomyces mirabilis TaxID=574656 RepID=A0AAE0WRB0_9PEZI|nr:hypothetical protein LTR78_003363 [Recurvomyces mirabilis]KAK5154601.1 hypothetical protein LTS14_006739 [Recurvomyces mirabilis]
MSLAARFADREDLRLLGPNLRTQASNLLKADLETLTVQSVQAWIVLGNAYGADCEWATESLYFGIAIRTAHIIRLHEAHAGETAVEHEVRLRVWWSLYMLDRWSAAGLGTPRQMANRHMSQQLPREEHVFHTLSSSQQDWPEPRRLGMWAYMITLVEVFGPIQDFNRTLSTGILDQATVTDTVARLGSRLEHWRQSLPSDLSLDPQTMALHQQRGHGRTFVALHLGYYHYGTLLYFSYLDGSAAQLPLADMYAQRCREYASALSDLLRTSYEMEGCEVMYNIVGHMAVVSSSVLIHNLLFGDQRELDNARGRLESNFRIIMKLKSWWPSVDRMKARLFMFQKACLQSIDQRTHKVDHWMVEFLLEHGNVLDERSQLEGDTPSPHDVSSTSPTTQAVFERSRLTRSALSALN